MTSSFKVIEHVFLGQHIREHPGATKGRQEDDLQIAVKQYVPLSESNTAADDAITIIGIHGNGFPKETYEPLWDDLHAELQSRGVSIRGIWVADSSNQGASGVLNEDLQGDSAHWFDHSRDLLLMINHFRHAMPRPLIGIAHSMGCAQLVHLCTLHPRLLSTVLLYEPVILGSSNGPHPAMMATVRRDIWPSRPIAEHSLSKIFRTWDPRASAAYMQYGLRSVPTTLYDPSKDSSIPLSAVTLVTSKHQEAWAYAQLNLEPRDAMHDRLLRPDWDPECELPRRTARPECLITMRNLPHLRPSALYVFGALSPLSGPEAQEEKIRMTGIGVGGSGGAGAGKVEKAVFEKGGHSLVFEQVKEAAKVGGDWIRRWMGEWHEEERMLRDYESKKSVDGMLRVSKEWVETTKMRGNPPRPEKEKL